MHIVIRVLICCIAGAGWSGFLVDEARTQHPGSSQRGGLTDIHRRLDAQTFDTRDRLLPKVSAHARSLTGQFDKIENHYLRAATELADWIAANYREDQQLEVLCICTANSRRSFLTATMGNIASAYYGFPNVHFYCGGTQPSACNPRTITTLRGIGVIIEETGKEAPRGDPNTANPIYRFRWGKEGNSKGMEALEFSKRYDNPHNPQKGFAALMVCSDADSACPIVKGAALRLSLPFLDPKEFDNTNLESQKYSERRDDIGRVMLTCMMQARGQLIARDKP